MKCSIYLNKLIANNLRTFVKCVRKKYLESNLEPPEYLNHLNYNRIKSGS